MGLRVGLHVRVFVSVFVFLCGVTIYWRSNGNGRWRQFRQNTPATGTPLPPSQFVDPLPPALDGAAPCNLYTFKVLITYLQCAPTLSSCLGTNAASRFGFLFASPSFVRVASFGSFLAYLILSLFHPALVVGLYVLFALSFVLFFILSPCLSFSFFLSLSFSEPIFLPLSAPDSLCHSHSFYPAIFA